MRFFFRSKKFKMICIIMAVVIAFSTVVYAVGETSTPGENIVDTLISPFRSAVNWVVGGVNDFFAAFSDYDRVSLENEGLRQENSELKNQLTEYEQALEENKFLKEFLEIKEQNKDFVFEPATVIMRDTADPYGSFTINKGSLDGINVRDPIITRDGLVGYVSEVGLSYSKVKTILDNTISVAAVNRRTSDIGVVGGSLTLAGEGYTRIYNINRVSLIAIGDYIVTGGGGVFPEGLMIGEIVNIFHDDNSLSLYASIKPAVDINDLQNVMVITYFSGQGH